MRLFSILVIFLYSLPSFADTITIYKSESDRRETVELSGVGTENPDGSITIIFDRGMAVTYPKTIIKNFEKGSCAYGDYVEMKQKMLKQGNAPDELLNVVTKEFSIPKDIAQ